MEAHFNIAAWVNPSTIYEVNIRQYTPEGTFSAFENHIPRLKDMGVTVLWLMPITPISEKLMKGSLGSYYACSSYTKINPAFGNEADLLNLIRCAHDHNIKVIIDWVTNHTGANHEWMDNHPDWFTRDAASLREAVTTVGWPTIDELRGRFMFVITVDDHVVAKHLARHPGLRGTALFADCGDQSPDGVFCVINDPTADGKRIGEVAARGVVIRTRADENVVEPLSGSTERQKQALASGACIVSTDFPAADPNMESGYMTCMPGGGTARIHPLANDPRAGQSIKP